MWFCSDVLSQQVYFSFTFVEALRESYAFNITKNHTPFDCQLQLDKLDVQ